MNFEKKVAKKKNKYTLKKKTQIKILFYFVSAPTIFYFGSLQLLYVRFFTLLLPCLIFVLAISCSWSPKLPYAGFFAYLLPYAILTPTLLLFYAIPVLVLLLLCFIPTLAFLLPCFIPALVFLSSYNMLILILLLSCFLFSAFKKIK